MHSLYLRNIYSITRIWKYKGGPETNPPDVEMVPVVWEKKYFDEKWQPYKTYVLSFKAPRCLVFLFEPSKVNDLCEFVNMETICYRYVIQYFQFEGLSPKNIKPELDSTLGESAPSFTTVIYWVAELKRDRTSCQGEHRSGRPIQVSPPDTVKKIHEMVLDDRRPEVRELAEMISISKSAIHRILTEDLKMRKQCARWLPRLLAIEQKQ